MSFIDQFVASLPDVGGFVPNPLNVIGLGAPVVGIKKDMTPEQQQMQKQVQAKADAGLLQDAGDPNAHLKYLRYLYDQQMRGLDTDPAHYKGVPTADRAQADTQKILQRNATQTANQNARLGKMGATKGADSLRMAVENSLTNAQDVNNIEAQAAWDEYQSKVKERDRAYGTRQEDAIGAVNRQNQRFENVQNGWQGQLGRFGKALVENGSAFTSVPGAVYKGVTMAQQALGNNNEYFRNTLGNAPVNAGNLLLDPNESVRLLQDYGEKQYGTDKKKNPFLLDTSPYLR